MVTRVRACNYIKIKTGRNFPPVLKTVTHTAGCIKMLMLLCMHMTSVLFLVLAGNFALAMYELLLELHALTLVPVLMRSCLVQIPHGGKKSIGSREVLPPV